jgi:hypothetical protein
MKMLATTAKIPRNMLQVVCYCGKYLEESRTENGDNLCIAAGNLEE